MASSQNNALKPKVLSVYKAVGLTPLQVLDRLRAVFPEYAKTKLTYAGRLDPLAEGVMLVAVGDEVNNKAAYTKLDKTYEFELLYGFSTDTHDVMGLVINVGEARPVGSVPVDLLVGPWQQEYPEYSSPKIAGKKSFSKQVEIYKADILDFYYISGRELLKIIVDRVGRVVGDFRQADIIQAWQNILSQRADILFTIVKGQMKVSSGTYVRAIAHELGRRAGCPALAFSIKRTRVGKYKIEDCLKID